MKIHKIVNIITFCNPVEILLTQMKKYLFKIVYFQCFALIHCFKTNFMNNHHVFNLMSKPGDSYWNRPGPWDDPNLGTNYLRNRLTKRGYGTNIYSMIFYLPYHLSFIFFKDTLLAANKKWSQRVKQTAPEFFKGLTIIFLKIFL